MNIRDIINLLETPISDFETIGDWSKSSSFRHAPDRKILTNPKAVSKIKAMWNKTEVDFNLMFLNAPNAGVFLEEGLVTPEWIAEKFPKYVDQIKIDPNAINILYTNNTGAERVPMTGWIIAHRFAHAIARFGKSADYKDAISEYDRSTANILEIAYGIEKPKSAVTSFNREYVSIEIAFFNRVATMRSARNGEIVRETEIIPELFAQYLLTGSIKFNSLPDRIEFGKAAWGRKQGRDAIANQHDREYAQQGLEDLAESLGDIFSNTLHRAVGKIYVM